MQLPNSKFFTDHELVNVWNIDPEQLYQEAIESTVKLMPPVVMPLIDKIMELSTEMALDSDYSFKREYEKSRA